MFVCLSGGKDHLAALSDTELAEVMAAARRQTAWAQARELAAIAELSNRRLSDDDDLPDFRVLSPYESLVEEVSTALTVTSNAAATLVDVADKLTTRLPGIRAALEAGRIDLTKARVICDAIEGLPIQLAAQVEATVLPGADEQTTGQLRRRVKRVVKRLAPEQFDDRQQQAKTERRVEVWETTTGTAGLAILDVDATDAQAIFNKITAVANGLKADGDLRPLDNIRADLATELLRGHQLPEAIQILLAQATQPTNGEPGQGAPTTNGATPAAGDGGTGHSAATGNNTAPSSGTGQAAPTANVNHPPAASSNTTRDGKTVRAAPTAGDGGTGHSAPIGNNTTPTSARPTPTDQAAPTANVNHLPAASSNTNCDGQAGRATSAAGDGGTTQATPNADSAARTPTSAQPAHHGETDQTAPTASVNHVPAVSGDASCSGQTGQVGFAATGGCGTTPATHNAASAALTPASGQRIHHGGTDRADRAASVIHLPAASSASTCDGQTVRAAPAATGGGTTPAAPNAGSAALTPTSAQPALSGETDRAEPTASVIHLCGANSHSANDGQPPRATSTASGIVPASGQTARSGEMGQAMATTMRDQSGAPHSEAGAGDDASGSADTPASAVPLADPGQAADDVIAERLAAVAEQRLTTLLNQARGSRTLDSLAARTTQAVQDMYDELAELRIAWCQLSGADHDASEGHGHPGYRPPAAMRRLVEERHSTCVFPTCNNQSTRCDLDHTLAYDSGGITCRCNLAPLCRRHHRTKQTLGWKLFQIWPGLLIWITPAGGWHIILPDRQ